MAYLTDGYVVSLPDASSRTVGILIKAMREPSSTVSINDGNIVIAANRIVYFKVEE